MPPPAARPAHPAPPVDGRIYDASPERAESSRAYWGAYLMAAAHLIAVSWGSMSIACRSRTFRCPGQTVSSVIVPMPYLAAKLVAELREPRGARAAAMWRPSGS